MNMMDGSGNLTKFIITTTGLVVATMCTTTSGQPVVSTTNATENVPVCPQQVIQFTCKTRGSPTIAWRSNEYIEDGGPPLEFGYFENSGTKYTSPVNRNTFAVLVSKSEEAGLQVIVSQLYITTSQEYSTFSVTCSHANGTSATKAFELLDAPEMPLELEARQRRDEAGKCTLLISLKFDPVNLATSDVSEFLVYIDGSNVMNETANFDQNSSLILTAYPVCRCAAYNVSVAAVNRCGFIGPSISDHVTLKININARVLPSLDVCINDVGITTEPLIRNNCSSTNDDNGVDRGFLSATVVLGVLLSLVCILFIIAMVTIIIIFMSLNRHKSKPRKEVQHGSFDKKFNYNHNHTCMYNVDDTHIDVIKYHVS